jgi:hypothetical protein
MGFIQEFGSRQRASSKLRRSRRAAWLSPRTSCSITAFAEAFVARKINQENIQFYRVASGPGLVLDIGCSRGEFWR